MQIFSRFNELNNECLVKFWAEFVNQFQRRNKDEEDDLISKTTLEEFQVMYARYSKIALLLKTNGAKYVAKDFLKLRSDCRRFLKDL